MPYADKRKLKLGLLGRSLDVFEKGKLGLCGFPTGEPNTAFAGGREWEIFEAEAQETVRAQREIVVTDLQGRVKEHTPVELSYELVSGRFQRVTETTPLPTSEAGVYDDFTEIAFTNVEVKYVIGTQAHAADSSIPLFTGKNLLLRADQDCYVRYNGDKRVRHFIPSGTYFSVPLKCSEIYVVRSTVDGTLRLWAVN